MPSCALLLMQQDSFEYPKNILSVMAIYTMHASALLNPPSAHA